MIVLDASVLIALFDARDPHHDKARELLRRTVGQPRGISTLTLAEVLVGAVRAGRCGTALRATEKLGIRELGFQPGAAAALAELRAETGLKLPDCCVLLAARQQDASVATFDDRLAAGAPRLGLSVC